TVAPGPERGGGPRLAQEVLEAPHVAWRDEGPGERAPVVRIALPEHPYEPALGVAVCRVPRVRHEERAVPPADLVVGEVTDAARVVPVRRAEAAGESVDPRGQLRMERVAPHETHAAAEREIDGARKVQQRRRQRPGA